MIEPSTPGGSRYTALPLEGQQGGEQLVPIVTVDEVGGDHLRGFAKVTAQTAIAELIWNALDADANKVSVIFVENALGGLEEIRVQDDGDGIAHRDAEEMFRRLGGSWKLGRSHTRGRNRPLHGKEGRGRFRAFRLGDRVEWITCFKDTDRFKKAFEIRGEVGEKGSFDIRDLRLAPRKHTGTTVVINHVAGELGVVRGAGAANAIGASFALHLFQHPEIRLTYDGVEFDPGAAHTHRQKRQLSVLRPDGQSVEVALEIVEWSITVDRKIYFCDEHGMAMRGVPAQIHAPNFDFTAYLHGSRDLFPSSGDLVELDPALDKLIEDAKEELRLHFKARSAERAAAVIDEWQVEGSYPYEGTPSTAIERIERETFDVVAVTINQRLSTFEKMDAKGRGFSLQLIRQALRESPDFLRRIMESVLGLSLAEQKDFAELLGRASLSGILRAGKLVADRIDLLNGLEVLIFERDLKRATRERGQLHEIVADNAWIFGEDYHLANKEARLSTVLRDHIRSHRPSRGDAVVVDGERVPPRKRVDLVFTRSIPHGRGGEGWRRNLVVELKRPSRRIDADARSQIEGYALDASRDDRFDTPHTEWDFWVIANEMDPAIAVQADHPERSRGMIVDGSKHGYRVWAKTWGQVFQEARGRMDFFLKNLELSANEENALDYLRRAYAKYLPRQAVAKARRNKGAL